MAVDSFKYLPRLVTRYYQLARVETEYPIPWAPLDRSLDQARFGLVTSGGLYHRGQEPPFDLEREEREPTWGDPGYRTLPADIRQEEVGISHHHIHSQGVLADMNILLPIQRFLTLVENGRIQKLVDRAYSFMGYQGFPANLSGWREQSGPEVAQRLLADGADAILLTTA